MASLDDLLTATKNIVVAINNSSTIGGNVVTALDNLNTTLGTVEAELVVIDATLATVASAINTAATDFLLVSGTSSRAAINASTLVSSVPGRLVRVSITTAGSSTGTIYDSSSTGTLTKPIWAIPNTIGIVDVSIPVGIGIVVVPGTGQVVTVTYS